MRYNFVLLIGFCTGAHCASFVAHVQFLTCLFVRQGKSNGCCEPSLLVIEHVHYNLLCSQIFQVGNYKSNIVQHINPKCWSKFSLIINMNISTASSVTVHKAISQWNLLNFFCQMSSTTQKQNFHESFIAYSQWICIWIFCSLNKPLDAEVLAPDC